MSVIGERSDRYLGDVFGIDERFAPLAGRESERSAHDGVPEEVFGEVLEEPARTQRGQFKVRSGELILHGADDVRIDAAFQRGGDQDRSTCSCRYCGMGESARVFHCARASQIGEDDVDLADVFEGTGPRARVLPVEGRFGASRAFADGVSALVEQVGDAPSGLARRSGDKDGFRVLCVGSVSVRGGAWR